MGSVTLDEVSKTFGKGINVLEGLNLEIGTGELLVLLGPSGCGKSTILRLIAGLEAPTSGRILFDGQEVTGIPTRQRNVAMVQQDGSLYSHLTARENIRFPLTMRRVSRSDGDREVEAEAAQLGIRALLGKMPSELSAGHRHSVATARALVQESAVLLLDEPLASLDARIRERTRLEILRLHADLGTTMVYVTNDHREAMSLGDRVAVFDETGALRQLGPPQEIYNRPGSLFVAEFLGRINHTVVRLERDAGRWWMPIGRDRLRLNREISSLRRLQDCADRDLVVAVRPEHVSIAAPGTPFAACLHGTVGRVEDAGSFALARVNAGNWVLEVRLPAERLPVPGNLIELTLDQNHLQFFDPSTGDAVCAES